MNFRLFNRYYGLLARSRYGLDIAPRAMLNYLAYTIRPYPVILTENYSFPILSIYVTKRCNLHCKFCHADKIKENSQKDEFELTPSQYEKILKHPLVKNTLVSFFCGGEPLLNNDIEELIKLSKKNGKIPTLATNAILLGRQWDMLLKAGIADIQISINDSTMDIIGKDIKHINEEMPLNASYVLLRSDFEKNKDKLENIVNFAGESGFKNFKFNLCVSNKHNNFLNEDLTEYNFAEYNTFKSKILKKYKNISIYFPDIVTNNKKKNCRISWHTLLLDAAGNFGFCCAYHPDSETGMNIFSENWRDLINNPTFCEVRKNLLAKDDKMPDFCKGCFHLHGSYGSDI
ncbi:MAG: radical SAM/SPASM domain-containing protein [Endomicrobiaceae bacterium]|jgi:MoaA/NifB/PqqE/SkfB family radical SAM enzyme|nr:radical SAM/SPASM domain-containing protein [Endomicrobiaceae bacterium]